MEDKAPILHKHSAWVPKRWEPVYEQMVSMSCRGISNILIGQALGYTAVQVGRIINSPEGEAVKQQFITEARKKLMDSADLGMEVAQLAAAENVRKILTDTDLATRNPFQMIRASMELLKGLGKLRDETVVKAGTVNNQMNFFTNLAPELQRALADGLEERKLLKALHEPSSSD